MATDHAPTDPSADPAVSPAQVGRSLRWTYATTAVNGVAQLAFAAVLARQLSPTDYGVVGVAASVLRFLQYFADLGIASAALQKRDLSRSDDVPVLFALATAANAALIGVLWIAAPLLLLLVPGLSEEGIGVLRGLAVAMLINGVGQTAVALMRRDLDFRAVGVQAMIALAVGQGGVAIPLAAAGFGPWSLVGGTVAQTAVVAALALRRVRPPLWPRRVTRARLLDLAALGGGFSALRILDSAGLHLLPLAVGALAGTGAVGLWDRAFVLAILPLEALSAGAGHVLFPVYGRLTAEPERLRNAWLSVILLGASMVGGVAAGMAAAAPQIVAVVLGPGWEGAAAPLAWLSIWALLRMFAILSGTLCEAVGRLALRGAHQLLYLAVLAGAFAALRPADVTSVAQVLVAVEVVAQAAMLVLAAGACGASPGDALRRAALALLPGLVVGTGTAAACRALSPLGLPAVVELTAAILAAAGLLAAAIVLNPSRTLRHTVSERLLGDVLGAAGRWRPVAVVRRWLER